MSQECTCKIVPVPRAERINPQQWYRIEKCSYCLGLAAEVQQLKKALAGHETVVNRAIVLTEENERLKKAPVKVHLGTSTLSRGLVWCACKRGLSLSGKWFYCPSCGAPIDQASYAAAVEQAHANGASHFYRDPEMVEEIERLEKLNAQMLTALTAVQHLSNVLRQSVAKQVDEVIAAVTAQQPNFDSEFRRKDRQSTEGK